MKPLRKHVALAIDGGGIKGTVAARALAILEEHLGVPLNQIIRLTAGTSTGSIISAGLVAGLSGAEMHNLYLNLGPRIFRRSLRTAFWPLTRYRYPLNPLMDSLHDLLGDITMEQIWDAEHRMDVVITAFDLTTNHTCFIKPWKLQYAEWPLIKAVAASCAVPTYFPPVEGRYVDGGVGAYTNPCYLAAYEIAFFLNWDPSETTLISLGTGRAPKGLSPGEAERFYAWDWIGPVLGAFMQSADDQQVHLVDTFFEGLDFRRFQVNLDRNVAMDDPAQMAMLTAYGDELGRKILEDETDPIQEMKAGTLG